MGKHQTPSKAIVDPEGMGIPFNIAADQKTCVGANFPDKKDQRYNFNELMYSAWIAFHWNCAGYAPGQCPKKNFEKMWTAWQGRRKHPNENYFGYDVLTNWPGYVVQLPMYMVGAFNSDETYQQSFRNNWMVDQEYYRSAHYHAGGAVYGLGAGATAPPCANGKSYIADVMHLEDWGNS